MEKIKSLSGCEEMVLSIVFDSESAPDLAEVMDRANKKFNKTWKPQTVSTFLSRLVLKGFLTSYREGRYSYYEPTVSRDEYCAAEAARMADLFFNGDRKKLIKSVSGLKEV